MSSSSLKVPQSQADGVRRSMPGNVFITRSEPEVALISWHVRISPSVQRIHDDPGVVCDLCGDRLDWEPFAVIDFPNEEELQDPEYVPIGGTALCRTRAMKFYHLTPHDVCNVDRLWLCHESVE